MEILVPPMFSVAYETDEVYTSERQFDSEREARCYAEYLMTFKFCKRAWVSVQGTDISYSAGRCRP